MSRKGGLFSNLEDREFRETSIFPEFLNPVFAFVGANGWILLFVAIMVFLVWKWMSPTVYNMYDAWKEKNEVIDPSVLSRRQDALMSARERFQHLVDENSSLAEQRAKELAEEKQKAKLEEWERHRAFGGGINDKSSRNPKDDGLPDGNKGFRRRPTHRPDNYNPLMGHGGGGGYRPTRTTRKGG